MKQPVARDGDPMQQPAVSNGAPPSGLGNINWPQSPNARLFTGCALIGIALLAMLTAVSTRVGFVSPDSWTYLMLADSLLERGVCHTPDGYSAMHPCGYPALIALLAWLGNMDSYLASKALNFALLTASGWFVYRATGNAVCGFLFVFNPATLAIGHYVWSENAFLLAVAMVCYALTRIDDQPRWLPGHLVLIGGLLIGISSRYFFAPFCFLMFLAAWRVYGSPLARRTVAWFALTAAVFFAHLLVNQKLTGFATGMPRLPASESFGFLAGAFWKYVLEETWRYLLTYWPVLAIMVAAAWFARTTDTREDARANQLKNDFRPYKLLMLLGLAYLVLAFAMRLRTQFDLFNDRTVGYGLSFLVSSALAWHMRASRANLVRLVALALTGAASLFFSQKEVYTHLLGQHSQAYLGKPFAQVMAEYRAPENLRQPGAVVPFNTPAPKWGVAPNPHYYYGNQVKVLHIATAPYSARDTSKQLKERLNQHGEHCLLDFTSVKNRKEMDYILSTQFDAGTGGSDAMQFAYDQELASRIRNVFVAGGVVGCGGF